MAAFTSAGSAWTTTAGDKTVTATPAANDLIVVIAGTSGLAGGTISVTDDNASGTYTQINVDRTGFSTTGVLTMWVRNKLITNASTVFTAAQTGSSGGGLQVCRISGMSICGLGAVRGSGGQSDIAALATPAPILLRRVGSTFSGVQAALTANLCIGAVCNGSASPSITEPASWTESLDIDYNTPRTGLETAFRNSGETNSTITWGGSTPTLAASMVIELDASVPIYDWVMTGEPDKAGIVQLQSSVGRNSVW